MVQKRQTVVDEGDVKEEKPWEMKSEDQAETVTDLAKKGGRME